MKKRVGYSNYGGGGPLAPMHAPLSEETPSARLGDSTMSKKPITDTSKLSSTERLATALPGGILAQEARGQSELVQSEQLPVKGLIRDRAAWEALGIKILLDANAGMIGERDSLFCRVELPAGWKKVPTEHSMWTNLVDANGRLRGRIFYKAAFYDRDAFITLIKDEP